MNKTLYAIDKESFKAYNRELKDLKANLQISTQEMKALSLEEEMTSLEKTLTIDGDKATIVVSGFLKPKLDLFDVYFGLDSTSYDQIIRSIEEANNNENVNTIDLVFNTPGGYVVGVAKTADVIRQSQKPITAVTLDLCASAGYWLASQCTKIVAQNEASTLGSIGVFATYYVDDDEHIIDFRSENAPYKNLNAGTPEGNEKIQKSINATEEIFLNYIVAGRRIDVQEIKDNFGRGDTMLSTQALNAKMIDEIDSTLGATPSTPNKNINNKKEDSVMDEKEMQKAIAAGIKAGLEGVSATVNKLEAKVDSMQKANEEAIEKVEKENARKANFDLLAGKYPEQKEMINKAFSEGEEAGVDFAMKVADAETSRLSAIDKTQDGNDGDDNHVDTKATQKSAEEKAKEAYVAQQRVSNPNYTLDEGVK